MIFILPILSSLIYISSFPLYISGYLAYFSLIPLLYAVNRSSGKKSSFIKGALFGLILSFFFSIPLFHALAMNHSRSMFLSLILILFTVTIPYTVIYGLFTASIHLFRSDNSMFYILIPPSLWILIDYLHELSPMTIPWGFAGYTQVFTPFIQIADITGIHGITFIIILSNTIIAEMLISGKKRLLPYTVFLLSLLITDLSYGVIRKLLIEHRMQQAQTISFLIVQENSGSLDRWNEASGHERYQTYYNITKANIDDTDYVVWPETVLNSSDRKNFEIMSMMSSLLNKNGTFITGGIRKVETGGYYNSIFVMQKDGLKYIYDKNILFPYSERPFFGHTAGSFMNSPEKFTEGKTAPVYQSGNVDTGFSICFESIYPAFIRKAALSGTELMVNVANDSWFGDSSEPHIQLYSIIARGVENRVSFIRAANSGISCAVSPSGEIISQLPLNLQGFLKGRVTLLSNKTIYTYSGDWIIILAVLLLLYKLVRYEKVNS